MANTMNLTEELKGSLNQIINGLSFLPAVKEEMFKDLSASIENNRLKKVLNGEDGIEILTTQEAVSFLKRIQMFSRDDRFDPSKLLKKEDLKYANYIDQKPFNSEFKEKFFKKYKPTTVASMRVFFGRVAILEKQFNKDLFDFSYEQLEELWKSLNSLTVRSLQNTISTVEQYISFAIKNKMVDNKINLASAFDTKEKLEKYVNKDAETVFSKKLIMSLCMEATNAQDGVIPALIFDGVSYKNEYEELINLRKKDIDFENSTINLGNRVIPMSSQTAILVRHALDVNEYYSVTGNQSRKYKIAESDYVLRGLRNNHQAKWRNVNQRILKISELNDLEYLNATTVSYSGQIHYGIELMNEGLSLEEAVVKIIERFNINDNESSRFYVRTRIDAFLKSQSE